MKISILGCGWLGLPLAMRLTNEGHVVKGSTTSQEKMVKLQDAGIIPFRIKLFAEGVEGDLDSFLSDAEILIVDIPPGLRKDPDADFIGKIGRLMDYVEKSGVEKLLFVSSTSVFEDGEDIPVYTEDNGSNGTGENSRQLISAEKQLMSSKKLETTVIRFGGLIGPGRHPVNYLSGKKQIKDPKAPVNLIHLEDCIGIILKILENEAWGITIHAVSPKHPDREHYYKQVANLENLTSPEFDNTKISRGKIIDSIYIKDQLDYDFQQPLV